MVTKNKRHIITELYRPLESPAIYYDYLPAAALANCWQHPLKFQGRKYWLIILMVPEVVFLCPFVVWWFEFSTSLGYFVWVKSFSLFSGLPSTPRTFLCCCLWMVLPYKMERCFLLPNGLLWRSDVTRFFFVNIFFWSWNFPFFPTVKSCADFQKHTSVLASLKFCHHNYNTAKCLQQRSCNTFFSFCLFF